jgi:redox-sensitive bicupin YhaK (pirin superfamily)
MDRFLTREPGRQTRHSFSFGAAYDPERVSFGPLVALNDDVLGATAGYDAHEHTDVVLVTWVVLGALAHEDTDGRTTQPAGQLAVTRAGSGITHSEHADGRATRFVQAWLRPGDHAGEHSGEHSGEQGGVPARRTTTPDLGSGDLVVVADADDLGIPGAELRIADVPTGGTVSVPEAALRYVFVVTGALMRSSMAEPLTAGDAFEITGDHEVSLTAAVPTQLLAWSFGS